MIEPKVDPKIRAEQLEQYDRRIRRMSHRQLLTELRKRARKDEGLGGAFCVVLKTILESTQTKENPFARLQAYPR